MDHRPPPPGRRPSSRGCARLALPALCALGRGRFPAAGRRAPPPLAHAPGARRHRGACSAPARAASCLLRLLLVAAPASSARAPRSPRPPAAAATGAARLSHPGWEGRRLAARGSKTRSWAGGRLTRRQRPGTHPCHPPVSEAERSKPRHWTSQLFPVFCAPSRAPWRSRKGWVGPHRRPFFPKETPLGRGRVTSCGLDSTGLTP